MLQRFPPLVSSVDAVPLSRTCARLRAVRGYGDKDAVDDRILL